MDADDRRARRRPRQDHRASAASPASSSAAARAADDCAAAAAAAGPPEADYADDQLRVLQQRKASLSRIKNKQKRNMVYAKLQAETKELRSKMRKKRHRDAEEAEEKGLQAPAKRVSRPTAQRRCLSSAPQSATPVPLGATCAAFAATRLD